MELIKADNGVEFLRSDKLISIHAFSTRVGGVSELSHTSSLNLAFGRGDEREAVIKNLRLFADAVGFDAEKLVSVSQIHSADVRLVDGSHAGQGYFRPDAFECDGYITNTPEIVVGVKTADCVPILMEGYDGFGRVCAVGAVHAGWRGTVSGIAVNCLEKMKQLGAVKIRVAIGPAICGQCFEVRRDFYETVGDILGVEMTDKFVRPTRREGVWSADIRAMNAEFLMSAGVVAEDIDISRDCTCCLPERYFSHRYSGGRRGTMLSVIKFR